MVNMLLSDKINSRDERNLNIFFLPISPNKSSTLAQHALVMINWLSSILYVLKLVNIYSLLYIASIFLESWLKVLFSLLFHSMLHYFQLLLFVQQWIEFYTIDSSVEWMTMLRPINWEILVIRSVWRFQIINKKYPCIIYLSKMLNGEVCALCCISSIIHFLSKEHLLPCP